MKVVQGDNNLVIPFDTHLDLTNCTDVEIEVSRPNGIITKTGTVIDALKGKCQFIFTSDDLIIAGDYQYQWTITFSDNTSKSGLVNWLKVYEKIGGVIRVAIVDVAIVDITIVG